MTEAERKLVAYLTREAGRPLTACEVRLALAQAQAIKRPGSSEDIVGTVLFLAGDSSAWVTGQTIMADGGLVRL